MRFSSCALVAVVAYFAYSWLDVSVYQITTAVRGVRDLLNLPQEDVEKCSAAFKYISEGTANSDDEVETENVRALYTVLHRLLAIADIEKMYIPPQLDDTKGLYHNQLLLEAHVVDTLKVGSNSTILDIGCGRGRISHHAARLTGGRVSGFNIDESQIMEAKAYAKETGLDGRLDFKVGDHHKRFQYDDGVFDGAYSVQALWPFLKRSQLNSVAKELFRVLKPGASYSCSEYLITPHFDRADAEHVLMHKLYMPTIAATQSNKPEEVTDALRSAGFEVKLSAPSLAPAWPVSSQKTALFTNMRVIAVGLTNVGLVGPWFLNLIDNLMAGGKAYYTAEKAKLMDLNWRIIVQKPLN